MKDPDEPMLPNCSHGGSGVVGFDGGAVNHRNADVIHALGDDGFRTLIGLAAQEIVAPRHFFRERVSASLGTHIVALRLSVRGRQLMMQGRTRYHLGRQAVIDRREGSNANNAGGNE